MAHRYEPDKMLQLVQLCCWKERTEMTQNGLIGLTAKLGPVQQSGQEPNDRYLVDLVSNARKALKDGSTITKWESYVNLLLNLAGFNNWDDWKEALHSPGYFLSPERIDSDISVENVVTIALPQLLQKQLSPTLTFAKKSFPAELLLSREETLSEFAEFALAQLEKSAAVVCALPLPWKDQTAKMRNPAWGEFTKTGRILPVWVDPEDAWNIIPPFIPSLSQQSTAGLPGLLTGILFLAQQTNAVNNSAENAQNDKKEQRSTDSGAHFDNSTIGIYMQGGTVHHLNTGGDQIVNNYIQPGTQENKDF